MSISQKIADIEAEIARTQKNKATEGHIGLLKAKIAKLKRELIVQTEAAQKGGGGEGFDVAKSGDSRVGLVGFPSVGKSTLLNKLTGQHSEVADYEFTTLTVIPGVIRYKGAKIQLLDLPGIIEGAKDGKGRGRQVIAVARSCSLILIVLDAAKPMTHKIIIEKELEGFGIRLNKKPPEITIKKKDKGGLNIVKLKECPFLDDQTIKSVCQEYRLTNADIMIKQSYAVDEFIDVLEGNRTYIPCLYVLNKIDQISVEELDILDKFPHCVPISAHHVNSLVERMWYYLDLIRIYTKPKGFMPDLNEPVILPKQRSSVQELCNRLHKQILKDFKYAIVWGQSVKHIPQKIGKDHVLLDEDVIQIVKRGS